MNAYYELAVNLPLRAATSERLAAALASFPVNPALLAYPSMEGSLATREAIAGWMRRHCGHVVVDPRRLVLTLGARHALSLALDEACFACDTLLVASSTYHGFRAIAEARGIHVEGVGMDGDGMLPAELDRMAATTGAHCVYIQPTLQNPTTATMPLARRREIAAVATQRDLTIIEGDVYSPLAWHDRDALPPELLDLVEEGLRIDHHAIADDRKLRRPQHARRQQRELVGLAIDHQGMTSIVAALEAHDDVGLLRQPVDDLALPLVAPLGADDDNIGHFADIPSATIPVRA